MRQRESGLQSAGCCCGIGHRTIPSFLCINPYSALSWDWAPKYSRWLFASGGAAFRSRELLFGEAIQPRILLPKETSSQAISPRETHLGKLLVNKGLVSAEGIEPSTYW